MTCASSVGRVEKALLKLPGVLATGVNLETEAAAVRTLGSIDSTPIADAVERARYELVPLDTPATTSASDSASLQNRDRNHLILAALLSLPLALPMQALPFGEHGMLPGWLQWLLATPAQF